MLSNQMRNGFSSYFNMLILTRVRGEFVLISNIYLSACYMPGIVFFFFNFNWRLITSQYCGGFCYTFTWISHGCTCVPHPEPPSYLLPHPIPQGHPSAPALSTLSHASNLDWRSVSYMIIYMFQCYSLRSSHLHLLPESKRLFYTSVSLLLSRI